MEGVWNRQYQLIAKYEDAIMTDNERRTYLMVGYTIGPVASSAPLAGEPCPTCGHKEGYKFSLDILPVDYRDKSNPKGTR